MIPDPHMSHLRRRSFLARFQDGLRRNGPTLIVAWLVLAGIVLALQVLIVQVWP